MTVQPYKASKLNKERAKRAESAMQIYVEEVGGEENDQPTNISDFLSDLIHYCIQKKISFENCLEQAETHVASERTGRE